MVKPSGDKTPPRQPLYSSVAVPDPTCDKNTDPEATFQEKTGEVPDPIFKFRFKKIVFVIFRF